MRAVLAWAALAFGIVVMFGGNRWGGMWIVVWLVLLDEKRGEA